MKCFLAILLFCFSAVLTQAQNDSVRGFTKKAVTVQYGGSIGFISTGFSLVSERNKLELGLLYGYLPASMGGTVHSATFKFTYQPFGRKKTPGVYFEPFQTGFFLSQSFGNNLGILWGKQYERLYYWWPKALRTHFFISSRLSWVIKEKNIDHLSIYLEANTNDLYISSYFPNRHSLRFYDIVFFGAGIRLCFR